MIPVKLQEQPRTHRLYVGTKLVGEVTVLPNGTCRAETVEKYLDSYPNLRAAVNRILRHEGYGNATDVEVQRAPGGRK